CRRIPSNRHLYRQNPQWGKAGRFTGNATDQVRAGDQPQDCQRPWPENTADAARSRRRGDRMRRRAFITFLGGAAAAWPLAARAQQSDRVRRIAVLMAHPDSDPEFQSYLAAFREGLQKLGWTEGRNIRIDSRWGALDDAEARQRSAKELLALQPDLILTQNTPPHRVNAATNPHYPHRVRDRCRSGRQRLRRELGAAGRQRHRFHHYGADRCRQMAGAAQGDCAEREPGGLVVQSGNVAICRYLPEPVQGRRCVLRIEGYSGTCSRQVRARSHRCRTCTRVEGWPECDAGWFPECTSRGSRLAGCMLSSACRLSVAFLC